MKFHDWRWAGVPLIIAALGCAAESGPQSSPPVEDEPGAGGSTSSVITLEVEPGVSVGKVRLGMSRGELLDALGEPTVESGFNRMITWKYAKQGLEVFLTSSESVTASADAVVRAVSNLPLAKVTGSLTSGETRESLAARWGEPFTDVRGYAYYPPQGITVQFDEDDKAQRFAVWPAYDPELEPRAMVKASTEAGAMPKPDPAATLPRYEIDGELFEVVDMHLHSGKLSTQQPTGQSFILSQLPDSSMLYYHALNDLVLDPYGQHLGLMDHTAEAGIAHGVVLATYTHHTIGHLENSGLETMLADPRNVAADGQRWAWGMASINFDDFEKAGVADERLAALNSYFEKRPDLFIGIKLAHAHQAVTFDDQAYLGLYDIAAKHGVPVLLHTGFSPFPGSLTEPEYYDPQGLKAVIEAYDGKHGMGRVDFVFAHVGQGDARAIEHSFELAQANDNVWLEISAIQRPLLIDETGGEVEAGQSMHPYVLSEIKKRGLVDQTIYASDGPQYFGKLNSYLETMVSGMKDAGYTKDDLRAVLSENFYRCYGIGL